MRWVILGWRRNFEKRWTGAGLPGFLEEGNSNIAFVRLSALVYCFPPLFGVSFLSVKIPAIADSRVSRYPYSVTVFRNTLEIHDRTKILLECVRWFSKYWKPNQQHSGTLGLHYQSSSGTRASHPAWKSEISKPPDFLKAPGKS